MTESKDGHCPYETGQPARWIYCIVDLGYFVGGKAAEPRMLLHGFLVFSQKDAERRVIRYERLHPLGLSGKLSERFVGRLGGTPQFLVRESSRSGDIP